MLLKPSNVSIRMAKAQDIMYMASGSRLKTSGGMALGDLDLKLIDEFRDKFGTSGKARVSDIKDLIRAQRNFVSTREFPSPSSRSGHEIDDLAAVLAGAKPAATISYGIDEDYRIPAMVDMARKMGLKVKIDPGMSTKAGELTSFTYVVGRRESDVKKIIELRNIRESKPVLDQQMGQLLGYHPQAIEDYIKDRQNQGTYG